MVEPWITEEMETLNLEDRRLDKRLAQVLSQLSGHPTASIPAACGGYAEMAAAYRLFDNEKVQFDNVLQPHKDATRRRLAQHPVVILPQDTTEIELTRPQQQVVGAGPLDDGPRRGVFLHLLHAFTPDGTPLGTVHAAVWVRPDTPPPKKSQRGARRRNTPIEDKESYRWVEGFRQASAEARGTPTSQFVTLTDSEGDMYEVLAEAKDRPANLNWIVRACRDRAVIGPEVQKVESPGRGLTAAGVRRQFGKEPVRFTQTIHVRGRRSKVACEDRGRRQPRQSRTAQVEVRSTRVTLRPPWRVDRRLPEVTVNVVWVREVAPPADEVPVEWMLLTSLPIDEDDQIRQVIQYYGVRWMIEIAFRTLKSGCQVEHRRFEHVHRLLPCLAVYLIVTWRTLYICRLGRAFPQAHCELLFEPAEWKATYQVVRRQPPPITPPPLIDMVRMVGQLGGYVKRKRADEPGPQTIWLGLQRVHDIALCWQLFGPETRTESQDV